MRTKNSSAGSVGNILPWKMQRFLAPTKDPKPSGGGDPPADDDDDDAFAERVNKIVHRALSERDKRLEKRIAGMISTTVTEAIDGLAEKLKPAAGEEDEEAPAKGAKAKKPAAAEAALSPEVEKRIKDAEKAAKDADAKLLKLAEKEAKAEAKARELEERGLLHENLNGKVRGEVLDMTVGHLRSRLVREVLDEETGESRIRWKDDDDEGTLLEPTKGIAKFLKSPAGLALAPATGRGGAGTKPSTVAKGPDGQPAVMSDADLGNLLASLPPR